MGLETGKPRNSKRLKSRKSKLFILTASLCLGTTVLLGCASLAAPARPAESSLGTTTAVAKYVSGSDVVVEMTWTSDSRCESCHEVEVSSMTNEALAGLHVDMTCLDCHTDSAALETAHADLVSALRAEPPRSLASTELPQDFCTACHDMSVIKTTTDGVIKDTAGSTFNPHDLVINEEHSTILCNDCHAMHQPEDVLETSNEVCSSCHHEGVFESCISCH